MRPVLPICVILAEVAAQQTLEGLAVAGSPTGPVPWESSSHFICSGGINPPGIEVLAPRGQNAR